MTSDAIINGNLVILSNEERETAEKFHKHRVGFAWINGKLEFIPFGDDRDHQHWMLEEFNISADEFENIPRGYMMDGRIQFFIGSSFKEMNIGIVSDDDYAELFNVYNNTFDNTTVQMYNGVIVGKVGEIWEPKINLGTFSTK
ncbi:MAG: hypothetical protein IJ593_05050 [Lachnospiraceae bacterium]|nr:hypothetical protein [Lachnospiraceae bacterium]